MDNFFMTFCTWVIDNPEYYRIPPLSLDEEIEHYASFARKRGYVEIFRSAPCLTVTRSGTFYISVTSTFSCKPTNKIFKTFTACPENLNDRVREFAKANDYVEIYRSAPGMAVDRSGNMRAGVTSAFIPK